jgi:hypothetical protein
MSNNPSSNDNHRTSPYELLVQLTSGPTSREVASSILRVALKEQYPTLEIDPDLAVVVTPRWRIVEHLIQPAPAQTESLTSVLARQVLSVEPVIYIAGEHFLTLQPDTHPVVHLPVKIDAIARLINELSDVLLTALQERQLDYWNASNGTTGPRWKIFSNSLRKVWNISEMEGWDIHECAMAKNFFYFPTQAHRTKRDPYDTRAYLIDIDAQRNDQSTHVQLCGMVVLVGEYEQRQMILMHSLVSGYEKLQSLDELGDSIPSQIGPTQPDTTLQWRLYEPDGDFFDAQATALIALQIEVIAKLREADTEQRPLESSVARLLPDAEELSEHSLSRIRQVLQRLPDWLSAASDLELSDYGRHIIDLAELHTHTHGASFRDGIAPIRDYTREQLQARIEHKVNGASLNLEKVEIVIQSPVIWGTLVLPDEVDITRRNLIDLALENLTGLPTGVTSVLYNGKPAPDGLSYSYLKDAIEAVDIGKHYPALIKRVLLDDPVQSKARQNLYTTHLRLQLPLLALQSKIQRKDGIDELGYRQTLALMQKEPQDQRANGQPIVIRPLAFVPTLRPNQAPDVVANMFVIGPEDHTKGPCLLYRPLLEPVLTQYSSRQNLIYAIKHDAALRESVLAWLPEAARFNYEQYVFPGKLPSPWTVVRGLIEPQVLLYMSGPIVLSDEVLGNDVMATLFKANANAMVDLATRQSVSNVQKRWATYKQAGWRIFNAALPFLGSTVGAAAWIWQIMNDLDEIAKAEPTDPAAPQPSQWTAQVDLLLNLGMALAMHLGMRQPSGGPVDVARRQIPPLAESTESPVEPLPLPKKPIITQHPPIVEGVLPQSHQGALHVSGALNRSPTSLGTVLDSFKIAKPSGLGEQNKATGSHLNLYPLAEKWYAPVGERWFEVAVDDYDNITLVDPTPASRTGPLLIGNAAGRWFIDTRLRLRGGGYKQRQQAGQGKKPARIEQLRKQLDTFVAEERGKHSVVSQAHAAIDPTPGPSSDMQRQLFVDQTDNLVQAYDVPIRQLRSLALIDNVPTYATDMTDYLNKQLLLTRAIVAERLSPFREGLAVTENTLEALEGVSPKGQADTAQAMLKMSEEMLQRMAYAQTRYKELENLGEAGMAVIQTTREALPDFNPHDLKSYQITLLRYLCIRDGRGEAFDDARVLVNDIVDTVDMHVQSLLDALVPPDGIDLDQRIEILNSLVEQFAIVDQRLLDLHAEHPEQVNREQLQILREQIGEFNHLAEQNLTLLLKERKALAPRPGPSRPLPAPRKRIIKTRFKGMVAIEPRAAEAGVGDVRAPITGKVIATFHEKAPNVWVERKIHPARPSGAPVASLDTSLNAGQALLDAEPSATQRTLAHSRTAGRIPVEIEEIFHQYAARLERALSAIEEALTQLNLTESDRPSAATLKKALNDAAQRLYTLGTDTRIHMTKQQPPTAARVEWMHSEGLLEISLGVTRRRLKGPGKNYLDEYEIRDRKTQNPLWYAHFHYASPEANREDFLAGHLKTVEQRKLGGALQQKSSSSTDQIAIYRSEISPQLARSVFFAE